MVCGKIQCRPASRSLACLAASPGNWASGELPEKAQKKMFERFTDQARKVVGLAAQEASRRRQPTVGTDDLLLGMVREGGGIAALVLERFKVDARRIKQQTKPRLFGKPSEEPAEPDRRDATLSEVANRSYQEAQWLGHNYCGTEHLLLGLCCSANCKATKVLAKLGVDPLDLCREVFDLLGRSDEWSRWTEDHPQLVAEVR